MSSSDPEPDSCARAASAAIEVVREECSSMDVEVREVEEGMLMEMPTDVADSIDDIDNSPVTEREFEKFVDESPFIRKWLGGIVASRDVPVDADTEAFASEVVTLARSVFEEDFTFDASDMVGTDTLTAIENAA